MKRSVAALVAVTLASADPLVSMATYNPQSVQDAWDNHHAAVGDSDVNRTLWDYVETSKVTVYKWTAKNGEEATAVNEYTGLDEIRDFFTDLYASMPTGSCNSVGGPAPVVSESPGQVFLIWWNPCDGYVNGTDSFTFYDDFKIFRQNIVMIMDEWPLKDTTDEAVVRKLASPSFRTSWDNRTEGFESADVDKVMASYDENAVVLQWDGEKLSTFDTQAKIRQMYEDLFATWKGEKNVNLPNTKYNDAPASASDVVFTLWDHRSEGYFEGTDTAIFSNNLIKHHNMVIWKTPDSGSQGLKVSFIGLMAIVFASRFGW